MLPETVSVKFILSVIGGIAVFFWSIKSFKLNKFFLATTMMIVGSGGLGFSTDCIKEPSREEVISQAYNNLVSRREPTGVQKEAYDLLCNTIRELPNSEQQQNTQLNVPIQVKTAIYAACIPMLIVGIIFFILELAWKMNFIDPPGL